MVEEWRDAPGFEGVYEVSSLGRVRSLTRQVRTFWGTRTVRGQIIKSKPGTNGYERVVLSVQRVAYTRNVHRMVCMAFNGPPPRGEPLACHRDGVKTHNTPENLYWGSNSDNMLDMVRHGSYRSANAAKTHCPSGHEYSESNTYIIPSTGGRMCRVCKKRQSLEHYHRRREGARFWAEQ